MSVCGFSLQTGGDFFPELINVLVLSTCLLTSMNLFMMADGRQEELTRNNNTFNLQSLAVSNGSALFISDPPKGVIISTLIANKFHASALQFNEKGRHLFGLMVVCFIYLFS